MADTQDTAQEKMEDTILLNQIVDNEHIITHPTFGKVRLRRPTPRMEKLIAEERRKQYHSDIRDPEILSKSQLQKFAEERGIWSTDKDDNYNRLVTRMGELMGLLESLKYSSVENVIHEYYDKVEKLTEIFGEDSEVVPVIDRYYDLDMEQNNDDVKLIREEAPNTTVDDLVDELHTLRTQITILQELAKVRKSLSELQNIRAELFVESIESRAERAEEYARLYYCTEKEEDASRLWASFDDIWDTKPEDLGVLITEMYYFVHGISDAYRDILGKHGLARPRVIEEEESEDSPEAVKTNSDGESQENEPETSLEPETALS